MRLRAVGDRIVVRPDAPDGVVREENGLQVTGSGLAVPREYLQAADNPQTGVILALGPGKVGPGGGYVPPCDGDGRPLEPGDRILYSQYVTGVDGVGDERLVCMRSDDVFFVLEEDG